MRSLKSERDVRAMHSHAGTEAGDRLGFFAADLGSAAGRPEANAGCEKARQLLGWSPRSNEESIVATAESLVRFSLVKTAPARRLAG